MTTSTNHPRSETCACGRPATAARGKCWRCYKRERRIPVVVAKFLAEAKRSVDTTELENWWRSKIEAGRKSTTNKRRRSAHMKMTKTERHQLKAKTIEARKALGLTQGQLADKAGVHTNTIRNLEQHAMCSAKTRDAVKRTLGLG